MSIVSTWRKNNFIEMNVQKAKELCIDVGTSSYFERQLFIRGGSVNVTDTFKCLGVALVH